MIPDYIRPGAEVVVQYGVFERTPDTIVDVDDNGIHTIVSFERMGRTALLDNKSGAQLAGPNIWPDAAAYDADHQRQGKILRVLRIATDASDERLDEILSMLS